MDEEAGTASVEVWFDRAALNDPNEMARVENQIREAAAQVCAPEGNYRRVSERTSHARCTRLATAQALAVLEARADAVQNDQRELLPRQND